MRRNNIFVRWYRESDKLLLITILLIVIIGVIVIASASPAIATRIKVSPTHFIFHHIIYLSISLIVMFFISCLNETQIRFLSAIGFIISIILLILVPYLGTEVKGAYRWLRIFGLSIQPSEFVKTYMIVLNAVILSHDNKLKYMWSLSVYAVIAFFIVRQPDFGMAAIITIIFIGQLFASGLKMRYIFSIGMFALVGAFISYLTVPHVRNRVNNFLSPSVEGSFQVRKSLEAFKNGNFVGVGPGEGTVKFIIPDSHTDFIFAVTGEEFGVLFCLPMIALFAFFTIKALKHVLIDATLFQTIAVTGIVIEVSGPAAINMAVNLNLLPTKGMVLPLVSYGGSSTLAISIALGILLSLTRTRYH